MMKFILLFLFFLSCTKANNLKAIYPHLKWDDSIKNESVTVDKEFQNKNVSGVKILFDGKLKGQQLISEMMVDIDEETADKLIKNKSLMIKGLYAIQATPYSGTITKEASCTTDMNIDPVLSDKKNQKSMQFDLKATERLVLGVCLEEQNVFRNQTLLIYCKSIKTFYDLRYYYPKTQKALKMPIANCY
jgi:hypothetical protein